MSKGLGVLHKPLEKFHLYIVHEGHLYSEAATDL